MGQRTGAGDPRAAQRAGWLASAHGHPCGSAWGRPGCRRVETGREARAVHRKQVLTCVRIPDLPVGLLIGFGGERLQNGLHPLKPPDSTRRCKWICADARVHTAADMLFRFYVHTPGKSRSVVDGKAEVKNAVSRLRSLRSMSATHV